MRQVAALAGAAGARIPGAVDRRPGSIATAVALLALLLGALLTVPQATVTRLAPPGPPASAAAGASATGLAGAAGWAQVPPLARLAISRGIGGDTPAYWAAGAHGTVSARNPAQHLSLRFTTGGVTVATPVGRLALSLRAVRADGRPLAAGAPAPAARANRVSYDRGAITEWYANGPLGLEQGFAVSRAAVAAAHRSLTVTLALHAGGGLRARAAGQGVDLLAGRRVALRYDGLRVTDARGRTLPAWMTLRGSTLMLHVRTIGARGPLLIDPVVQDAQLLAEDGQQGDGLGQSVAVSGSLVAVGANNATVSGVTDAGAVYVFTEPASGWANASSAVKLTAATPQTNALLGTSVAISGNTVFAGAPTAAVGTTTSGAVYIFAEPAGGWTSANETGELTESGGAMSDNFGYSLAVSGGTLVVGAPFALGYSGSLSVYREPAGGWASESPEATLTTSVAGLTALGLSVAIDGSTIVAGAPLTNSFQGQVDVFTEPSAGWASGTQTALLSSSDGGAQDGLGAAVGVFGNTVIAGSPGSSVGANAGEGAVYLYEQPASGGWVGANETAKLTAANGAASDALGTSVLISGPTIFAGAPGVSVGAASGQGAVYLFSEPANGWATATSSSEFSETTGTASDGFGGSIALSGITLAIGASNETVSGAAAEGSAFVFGGLTAADTGQTGGGSSSGSGSSSGGGSGSGSTRKYATVTAVSGGVGRAVVSLKCTATTGKCVAAKAELVIQEKLRGSRLVGTEAKSATRLRRVELGDAHVTLLARAHTKLLVYLNSTGRGLLRTRTRLSVGLGIDSVGRVLRNATVTISRPPAAKKKAK